MKYLVFLFLFVVFLSNLTCAQSTVNKEIIYISYNKSSQKKKRGAGARIRFLIGSQSFLYEASKNRRTQIGYSQMKDSLITVRQAEQIAKEYLKNISNKFKRQTKSKFEKKMAGYIKNPGIYYYNRYFKKIYLFEKTNKCEGILYEVKWESYIE